MRGLLLPLVGTGTGPLMSKEKDVRSGEGLSSIMVSVMSGLLRLGVDKGDESAMVEPTERLRLCC